MKKFSRFVFLLPWVICTLGALFYAYEYLLRIAPSVMTVQLMRHYQIHAAGLGNLSAFYYYIYTPMQLVAGVLMDRYGPRRLLTLATLCCVLGSFLFAGTSILIVAQLGRLLIGFGSAFAFVGVLKLATIWLPRRYFAMYTGIATALGMLGAGFGAIFMTNLVSVLGWQQTIFIAAFLGIVLAIIIGLIVRDEPMDKYQTEKEAVDIKEVVQGLWSMLKSWQMWLVGLVGGLLYIPASAFAELWGIPYLVQAHDFSPEKAAFGMSLIFIGWALGGPIVGWFSDSTKRRNMPIAICGLMTTIFMTAIVYGPNLSPFLILTFLFLIGIFSGGQVIVFAIGKELNLMRFSGSAIAFTNMTVMLSGLILQPLIGYILDSRWNGQMINGVRQFSAADYQIAMVIIPICLILGVFIAQFLLKETKATSMDTSATGAEVGKVGLPEF